MVTGSVQYGWFCYWGIYKPVCAVLSLHFTNYRAGACVCMHAGRVSGTTKYFMLLWVCVDTERDACRMDKNHSCLSILKHEGTDYSLLA